MVSNEVFRKLWLYYELDWVLSVENGLSVSDDGQIDQQSLLATPT